ncbi:hypothetical protein BGX34_007236 [Mortierella sp. NVP85]|nr:hypothetical protein BGX34_007236 [Mortierella sp. NVP85]
MSDDPTVLLTESSTRVLRKRKAAVEAEPAAEESSTRVLRQRKLVPVDGPSSTSSSSSASSSSPAQLKRRGRPGAIVFTVQQEVFIAEQLANPNIYEGVPGRLVSKFYRRLPQLFEMEFGITYETLRFWKKVYTMKKRWRDTYQMKHSAMNRGVSPSALEMLIRKRCHYYFILEPVWGKKRSTTRTDPVEGPNFSARTEVSDQDDGDDDDDVIVIEDYSEDYDEGHGEGMDNSDDGIKVRSNASAPGVVAVPVKKSHVKNHHQDRDRDKDEEKARTTQAQIRDMLVMLKDIKDSSIVQYEAEKEQTRREQMRLEERTTAQQEITRREQLRVEEVRLREEENTKRMAIRAEVEKMKDQVRMKELELEHTNRLLLLEETRMRRVMLEKENFALKKEESVGAAELQHRLEASQ